MRRAFDKARTFLNAILAQNGGVDPDTGKKRKLIKNRFVAGDNFWQGLQRKRISGKWRVRGPRKETHGEHLPFHRPDPKQQEKQLF